MGFNQPISSKSEVVFAGHQPHNSSLIAMMSILQGVGQRFQLIFSWMTNISITMIYCDTTVGDHLEI